MFFPFFPREIEPWKFILITIGLILVLSGAHFGVCWWFMGVNEWGKGGGLGDDVILSPPVSVLSLSGRSVRGSMGHVDEVD